MCIPVVAVQAALAIASAAASYSAASSSAKATAEGVKRAGDIEQMGLAMQRDQQYEASAQQANEHARAAARDAALFDTVAGEYGGGNTIDRTAAVSSVQEGEQLATISRNAQMAQQQNSMSMLASRASTNAKLASIQQPSKVGLALKIGGAAAQFKQSYLDPVAEEAAIRRRADSYETMPYLKSNRSLGD